jgi:hypothetical protein
MVFKTSYEIPSKNGTTTSFLPEPKRVEKNILEEMNILKDVSKDIFEPVEGIIVLIDVLGTKGIWERKDPAQVVNSWAKLKKNFVSEIQSLQTELRSHGFDEKLGFNAFSDTIIISWPVTSRGVGSDRGRTPIWWAIMLIGKTLSRLIRVSISDDFYFRGCVSAGKFYRTEDMIIGPTIDEADEYYSLPQWSGISCSPSASKVLTDAKEMSASIYNYFIQSDIPLKHGIEKNAWALNWPSAEPNYKTANKQLRQILYEKSRSTDGIFEYFKIKNTLNFFDATWKP